MRTIRLNDFAIRYQAGVIFAAVTILGVLSWYFTPEGNWLRREAVLKALDAAAKRRDDLVPQDN